MMTPGYAWAASLDDDLDQVEELRRRGDYEQAATIAVDLLARADRELGRDRSPAPNSITPSAWFLKATGDYAQARDHYEAALALFNAQPSGQCADEIAALYHNLAGIDLVLASRRRRRR
jgi:hypothetical protein